MTQIWKFELKLEVEMPINAEILTIQVQHGNVYLWAIVDSEDQEREIRIFENIGTGHTIPDDIGVNRKYIATYQLEGGALVYHVFERID